MSAAATSSLTMWIAGAVVVGAVGAGAVWYNNRAPVDSTQDAVVPVVQTQPADTTTETVAEETPNAETAADESAVAETTRLEEVRVDSGVAVIAGRTVPFQNVVLRADGEEIARATADSTGAFATVAILSASAAARILTVAPVDDAGVEGAIEDELILAPIVVADATDVDTLAEDAVDAPQVAASPTENDTVVADAPVDADLSAPQITDGAVIASSNLARPNAQDAVSELDGVNVAALDVARSEADQPDGLTVPKAMSISVGGDTLPDTSGLAQTDANSDVALQDDVAALDVDGVAQPGSATDVTPRAQSDDQSSRSTPSAPAQPQSYAILRADKDGINVVQPANTSPEAQSQVALDAISYSTQGDVQLTGRAQGSADQIQVYLNNRPIAALKVDDEGGWRGALPDVDTGVYTLRIDELNDAGQVTSRVETPFKREDPEVLQEATERAGGDVAAITVQKGATLWAIARERYGEGTLYVRVFEANKDAIRDPDLIYPGQVFNLPDN